MRSGVPTVRHGALCVVNEGGPLAWAPLRPEVARRIAAELVREAVRQEQEARP